MEIVLDEPGEVGEGNVDPTTASDKFSDGGQACPDKTMKQSRSELFRFISLEA